MRNRVIESSLFHRQFEMKEAIKNAPSIEKVDWLLRLSKQEGLYNQFICNTAITRYVGLGGVNRGFDFFLSCDESELDSVSYSAMISAFIKENEYWQAKRLYERAVQNNKVSVKILTAILIPAKRLDDFGLFRSVQDQMKYLELDQRFLREFDQVNRHFLPKLAAYVGALNVLLTQMSLGKSPVNPVLISSPQQTRAVSAEQSPAVISDVKYLFLPRVVNAPSEYPVKKESSFAFGNS